MSIDDYADRLAEVATELVVRVRDDDPEANLRWLGAALDDRQRLDLLFVLAAAVPDDQPWHHLTAWVSAPRRVPDVQPHGTPAAAKRHRAAGEEPCAGCREAEREDWRIRKQNQRARQQTTEKTAATTEEVAA